MSAPNAEMVPKAGTAKRDQVDAPFGAPQVYVVVVVDSKDPRSAHRITGAETVLGRDADADFRIDDDKVSKKHCTIRVQGTVCTIIDHASLNGTCVNRKQLRPNMSQRLRHLDEIEIGDTKLLYLGGKITGAPRRV